MVLLWPVNPVQQGPVDSVCTGGDAQERFRASREHRMAAKTSKSKVLPIGIDLGSSVAKVAQLRVSEGELELLAARQIAQQPPAGSDRTARLAQVGGELRKMLRGKEFSGHSAVLSIPAEETFVHHVRIPRVAAAEQERVIHGELRGKLPYSLESAIVRYLVAGDIPSESEPRQEVLTVSVPRAVVEGYLQMAAKARLNVVGVNIESCAIVECFARLFRRESDKSRAIMYVDIGTRSTQVVLSHGPRIVFARNLPLSGERFDGAVAEALSIPLGDARRRRRDAMAEDADPATAEEILGAMETPIGALAAELTQCLRYYETVFRGDGVERAIFLGGGAYDKRLCQAIARRANLPAQIGDPLAKIRRGEGMESFSSETPRPDWAVAVGLSIGSGEAA
jgi:type IV pilus assembly protein PilM